MSKKKLDLKISKVTVFQKSAQIKMERKIYCEKGLNELNISHLSKFLKKDSVRIKGKGQGRIENIIVEQKFSEEFITAQLNDLKDELENHKKQRSIVENELENLKYFKKIKETAFDRFANEFPKYYSLNKIEVENIDNLDSYLMEEIRNLTLEIIAVDLKLKDFDKKIEKIQNEINQIIYHDENELESFYNIELVLNAEESGEFFIELIYMVDNSWWEPFYDIVIRSNNLIELDLIANVFNQTLMNWNDIELEISTATTSPVKLEIPQPYNIDELKYRPHYIQTATREGEIPLGAAAPAPPSPKVALKPSTSLELERIAKEPKEELPELGKIESNVSANFGVQTYSLKAKFDIPSDKNPKPVPLMKLELESIKEFFWSVVSPDRVLCNNKVKNKNVLILPGKAKIYMENEFIGETFFETIAPYEEFKIGERISYDIKVKKELKSKEKQKEGIKAKRTSYYKYEISIENLSGVQEELILYDRIPYSVSEKIKVRIISISDEPVENNMNVLKFVIPLKDVKDKKIIKYEYEVTAEKDVEITPPIP